MLLLFSSQVMSDSLQPHGPHASPACQASLSLTISCSLPKFMSNELVMPSNHLILCYTSCHRSFPASGSFPVSWLFMSGGQSIEASASASVLPKSIQGWFPLRLTGLISLLSKGLLCTIMLRKKHNRDFWWCVANRGDKCMKLASSFKITTHSGWLEQYWSIPFVSV